MYQAFEKLTQEKKDLIIKVAIEEFSQNGFEKASTDTIAKRAGISKGSLFHYFKSKKNLFVYLAEHVMNMLIDTIMDVLRHMQADDFFEHIIDITLMKQRIAYQYSSETQFLLNALMHPPVAVKPEMETILAKQWETYQQNFMYKYVYQKELLDHERLRPDVNEDTVVEMTRLLVENISNKYQMMYRDQNVNLFEYQDQILKELQDYFSIIKNGIYR